MQPSPGGGGGGGGVPGIDTAVAFQANDAGVEPAGPGPPDSACTVICVAPAGTVIAMLLTSHSLPALLWYGLSIVTSPVPPRLKVTRS